MTTNNDTDGPRAGGMQRITVERTVRAVCLDCGHVIEGAAATGAAASHARSKRHAMRVDYSTTFVYAPDGYLTQVLGGGRS
ncbi:UBP-type zinc finger domain-containing protein [Isoptericola sp. NPDC057191]|uniref:UBP-type zinc finger domain-containing protein n=1 Tax=Isoptericola sp. NPDC057191 TaxID=3346041 RepID=UPI00363F3F15